MYFINSNCPLNVCLTDSTKGEKMYLLYDGDYIDLIAVLDNKELALDIILENEKRYNDELIKIEKLEKNDKHMIFILYYPDSVINGTNNYNLVKVDVNKLLL